uniref:Uncharacterized protein n=1 Tax=Anguilla anguilla TaxID=7936 RepID=A0A0E9Q7B1_ANGAN
MRFKSRLSEFICRPTSISSEPSRNCILFYP